MKRKIVYICNIFIHIAGVEKVWTDKMNYWANKGEEIYLITASQGNHPFPFPLSPQVKHIDLNINFHTQYQYPYPTRLWMKWKLNAKFRRKLKEAIMEINPDFLVATTYWQADAVCTVQSRGKKIIESHCTRSHTNVNEWPDTPIWKNILEHLQTWKYNRIIETKSDAVVTLTQKDAQKWRKARRTAMIPNPVFPPPYSIPTDRNRPLRAIAVGRLTYQKGFDRLISAWKEVNDKYPEWKLEIFGEGGERIKLIQQIKSLGLEQSVFIHHATLDIWREHVNSSFYILSSRFEGFGLVLVEAMNCGLPCISFDCPDGPSEIIEDRVDGILVENNNIPQMTAAICYLIENENIRKVYGQKARENAKRFLPENIMEQWEKLFNQLTFKKLDS